MVSSCVKVSCFSSSRNASHEEAQIVGELIAQGPPRQTELLRIGSAAPQQVQCLGEVIEVDNLPNRFVAIAVVKAVVQLLEPSHLLQIDLPTVTLPGPQRQTSQADRP